MRALQFRAYGGPEVLQWAEAPDPHAGPGQIRIAVRAASVNPIDWKTISGAMAGGKPMHGVGYLGYDAAGVVDQVGDGVTGVAVAMTCSAAAATPRRSTPCWTPGPPSRRRSTGRWPRGGRGRRDR
jgi:NADPH:quinone reductase-like Zn-dependent oxidoreductase